MPCNRIVRAVAALALCLGAVGSAAALQTSVCYNYDCAMSASIELDEDDLAELETLFNDTDEDADTERDAIALAVGAMYRAAGRQCPIHNDRGGNAADGDADGRMDCLDHTANTTRFLQILDGFGWLHFHHPAQPVHRRLWLVDEHWSASVATDDDDDQRFVVDGWFFDFGHDPAVIPLPAWLEGEDPR